MGLPDIHTLEKALNYLAEVIQWRMDSYFNGNGKPHKPMPNPPEHWLTAENLYIN